MTNRLCIGCDSPVQADAQFCSICGAALPATGPTKRLVDEVQTSAEIEELPNTLPICYRCQIPMERGFMADHTPIHPILFIDRKLEYDEWGITDLEKRHKWIVRAYRCPNCGLLESYAKTRYNPE